MLMDECRQSIFECMSANNTTFVENKRCTSQRKIESIYRFIITRINRSILISRHTFKKYTCPVHWRQVHAGPRVPSKLQRFLSPFCIAGSGTKVAITAGCSHIILRTLKGGDDGADDGAKLN